MNHRRFQALLIQNLMHKLKMQKPLHLTRRTQNEKDSRLLANQLLAIQPGIEALSQPRRLNLISDTV